MKKIFPFLICLSVLFASETAKGQGRLFCSASHQRNALRTAQASSNQQKLMARYDVNYYKLDVALERTSTYIAGNTLIQAKVKMPLDTFAFELHADLAIDSIVFNNQKRVFSRSGGVVYVKLNPSLSVGAALAAKIYYKGTPPAAQTAAIGAGMSSAVAQSWGNRATWSLSQPFSAYEWFPCKQELTDKADSSEVWVTTSNTNKAGSNGLLKRTVNLPGSKVRYEWKSRYPIDYYLISVSVSDYVEYTISANPVGAPAPIPIQNYIYSNPGTLLQYQNDINDTKLFIEKFSELYGLYPFYKEKYGHCMAPFSGGMEHQTMTTQGLFQFDLTSHELAHQWFGDNVTCGSWRDIWLNESFASYSEYLAFEKLRNGQQRSWMDNTHNNVLSQPGGSVYVPAADSMNVARIFDGRLSYDKGAAVIHTLRFELNNDTVFFSILKKYQQQYKNSTAKTPNFKLVAETISGKNLTQFFNQWIYGEGFPTFDLTWNQTGNKLILRSIQSVSKATITPLFQTDIEYKLLRTIGDTTIRVRQNQLIQNYTIPVRGSVTGIQIDPNQWVLNGTGNISKDINLVNGMKSELEKQTFVVYPNPTSEFIQVSGVNFVPSFFEVFDATGRCLRKGNFRTEPAKISTSELANGVYVLKLSDGEKSCRTVFQKQ